MEILEKWLVENVPIQTGLNKLVHGDWRIDNLIFSKKDFSLSAVLKKQGDEWVATSSASETWNPISSATETWNEIN